MHRRTARGALLVTYARGHRQRTAGGQPALGIKAADAADGPSAGQGAAAAVIAWAGDHRAPGAHAPGSLPAPRYAWAGELDVRKSASQRYACWSPSPAAGG